MKDLIHESVQLSHCGIDWKCDLKSHSNYLCFTIHHRTNDLVLRQQVSKRQIIVHQLIKYLHEEEGMSYRRITKFLNRSGIKTHTNKFWGVTGNSVYSVLKRFKEREERMNLENKKYDTEITDFQIKYLRN
jgi:hypothetical protein